MKLPTIDRSSWPLDFDSSIALAPDFLVAYLGREYEYLLLQRYVLSVQDATKAIELIPDYAGAFGARGLVHFYLDNDAQAIQDFERCLELEPNSLYREHAQGLMAVAKSRSGK